jgi:hypothetical protein
MQVCAPWTPMLMAAIHSARAAASQRRTPVKPREFMPSLAFSDGKRGWESLRGTDF